jgi:hypothetical protein
MLTIKEDRKMLKLFFVVKERPSRSRLKEPGRRNNTEG